MIQIKFIRCGAAISSGAGSDRLDPGTCASSGEPLAATHIAATTNLRCWTPLEMAHFSERFGWFFQGAARFAIFPS